MCLSLKPLGEGSGGNFATERSESCMPAKAIANVLAPSVIGGPPSELSVRPRVMLVCGHADVWIGCCPVIVVVTASTRC